MTNPQPYVPPKVWSWDKDAGGEWAKTNRPTAGATHEADLPIGEHSLQLYSLATPNGQKVTIMLEELLELGVSEAEYDAFPIRITNGDQFSSGFVKLNPNSKIPALYDREKDVRVFESGHILLYLAEKFGHFLPEALSARTETLNWLFWLQGAAPYLGGGFGHFYHYAPEKLEYPINRFTMEVKRQLDLLNQQLATHRYLAGDTYTIADIATWPWHGNLARGLQYNSADFLQVEAYEHVRRWAEELAERPAVIRGRQVNRTWGEPSEQLPERHAVSDFGRS